MSRNNKNRSAKKQKRKERRTNKRSLRKMERAVSSSNNAANAGGSNVVAGDSQQFGSNNGLMSDIKRKRLARKQRLKNRREFQASIKEMIRAAKRTKRSNRSNVSNPVESNVVAADSQQSEVNNVS
ncbi:hypothetical protein CVS40_1598 [Lucilia cuprina]|nr:hypothetical protein CVS40_1598 [Lucilia cuprina]